MYGFVIHVGYGKTGTSAIQAFLKDNEEALFAGGALAFGLTLQSRYLPDGNARMRRYHELRDAVTSEGADEFADFIAGTLRQAVELHPHIRQIIWSNEDLMHRTGLVDEIVKKLGKDFTPKIIIYLRHQADWLVSAYYQWAIKHKTNKGRVWDFERFAQNRLPHMDYLAVLKRWEERLDKSHIAVRSYDSAKDVVVDFMAQTGIPPDGNWKLPQRVYETPSMAVLSLLKIHNDQFDEPIYPDDLVALLEREGMIGRSFRDTDPTIITDAEEVIGRLKPQFEAQNAELKSKYNIELCSSVGEERLKGTILSHFAPTSLVAILLSHILGLHRRIAKLEAAAECKTVK